MNNKFRIYRGHNDRLLNEISWTFDLNIAGEYAIGWEEERQISTGIVSKQSVIAFVDRWQESEIIVPARVVKNIETQPAIRIDK
jgi:anti-sigma-K factor RskA